MTITSVMGIYSDAGPGKYIERPFWDHSSGVYVFEANAADAYFTVDAALIMPMVLALYVLIIYASFFMYDRCIAEQDAYILCMREGTRKDAGPVLAPDPQRILADENRQHGTKYIALSGWKSSAGARGSKGIYEAHGVCAPPVMQNIFSLKEGIWTIRVRSASRKSDPPLLIRQYRRRQYIVKSAAELFADQKE